MSKNVAAKVAEGFGREWSTFRQDERALTRQEREAIFQGYFGIFPWNILPASSVGMDVGCGSGRWSAEVAPRVGHLHLLDVSPEALAVAKCNLAGVENVSFHLASVNDNPLPSHSLDFAFSLGVLHHVPDTQAAIDAVADKLKSGAPFLIYLYYAFDNRPAWFRFMWIASNFGRIALSRLPHPVRLFFSQIIAALIYWPLARLAKLVEGFGCSPHALPLSWYRDRSFYVMRTDAYDRFCTRLEQRFTKFQISNMLSRAGFRNIIFSDAEPYWCALGIKR
jgi:SAM-dependent methyltransferase